MTSDADQTNPSGATHGAGIPREGAASPQAPALPWLKWAPGERVVLRYRQPDGLHDALGTLVETAIDHVVIDTRRGPVRVEASTMVTGKKVPPPPMPPSGRSASPGGTTA